MKDREKYTRGMRLVESSDAPTLSRRMFLAGAGAAVLTLLAAGDASLGILDARSINRGSDHDQQELQAFADKVAAGMAHDWHRVSVWPGAAIVPENVGLFSSPNLSEDTRLDWPTPGLKLFAQRPFMTAASMELSGQKPPADLGSQVMSFWLPHSNQVAHFDRQAYRGDIQLLTRSRERIFSSDHEEVSGEHVTLAPPLSRENLTWRYLVADYQMEKADPVRHVNKVVGRSLATADIVELQNDFLNFTDPYGAFNIITLPKAA